MACGWAFALIMAVLPLFGVSDYRKFAICLPFETTTGPGSLAYVVFLMVINGVAFLILMGCYLKMYCAIRGSQVGRGVQGVGVPTRRVLGLGPVSALCPPSPPC